MQNRTNRYRHASRWGAVTVEFAIMSSIVFMLILGTIEFSRVFMIRGSVSNAAYQGARRGMIPGATASLAEASARDTLNRSFVRTATITVTPANITSSTSEVTVTVRVNLAENAWIPSRFTRNMFIQRSCTLSRQLIE
jgi:Flp pilus assembly protein TadG